MEKPGKAEIKESDVQKSRLILNPMDILNLATTFIDNIKLYQITEIEGEIKDDVWFYADQENLIFSLNLKKKKSGAPFEYEIVAQNFNHPIDPKKDRPKDKSKLRSAFRSIFGKYAHHTYLIPLKDMVNLAFGESEYYQIIIESNGKSFDITKGETIDKMSDYLFARIERVLDIPNQNKKVKSVKPKSKK